jgi:hypothetical protein
MEQDILPCFEGTAAARIWESGLTGSQVNRLLKEFLPGNTSICRWPLLIFVACRWMMR